MTISNAYHNAIDYLKDNSVESPEFNARELIFKAFGIDRNSFIMCLQNEANTDKLIKYEKLVRKRAEKIPLQYLLGSWDFMGYEFFVGDGVLIPREDTQALVELALSYLKNSTEHTNIADLCAGSGIISIVLAKKCPLSHLFAFEKSKVAYNYLKKNIVFHSMQNIKAINEDIFKSCENYADDYFDLIVSNPPYISQKDMITLQDEVKKEPHMALFGGKDGLDFYRGISKYWYKALKGKGKIVLEMGINQKNDITEIFENSGYRFLTVKKDINDIDRAIAFEKI